MYLYKQTEFCDYIFKYLVYDHKRIFFLLNFIITFFLSSMTKKMYKVLIKKAVVQMPI